MTQTNNPDYYREDGSSENGPARGFNDYLRWFLRRFWIFCITLIGGYVLGQYIYSITPPTYRASATIEILRVKREAADVAEEEKIRMTGAAEMLSASERLRLPVIYVEAAKGPLFANRENLIPEQMMLPWTKEMSYSSEELTPEIIGAMLSRWVNVKWRRDTALLDLSAEHSDPSVARDSLVAVLAAYEQLAESRLSGSSEYALDYILSSSADIKDRLLELESAVRLYQRCSELSIEIQEAERQVAEMEKRYLPKWPALVEAIELQRILKGRFSAELDQVIRISPEEKAFWEKSLADLGQLSEAELIDSKRQIVATRSSVLQRELDAEKQIYDNLIMQLKEGNVTRGFASRQFEIVQPPIMPGRPSAPIKEKIITLYAGGGAALGLGIILLLGFMDPTVRTVAELEHLAELPVVGAMPVFKKQDDRSDSLELSRDPDSQASEAIRTLRTGLTFLGTSEERKVFLITSAIPGEGKSWVASNLALSFAIQGNRTLLIDADMRRPVHSEVFGYPKESIGLSDQLSLGTPVKEILMRSKASENLFLFPAGSWSPNPAELLSGKALRPLLEKLGEFFDRIVIDSAPLVPVSDTIPLAKLAQSVVLVTRIGKTPKGAVKRALRVLHDNGSIPVGIVANGLPRTRTMGVHGYYYSYSSGGSYSGYAQPKKESGYARPKK